MRKHVGPLLSCKPVHFTGLLLPLASPPRRPLALSTATSPLVLFNQFQAGAPYQTALPAVNRPPLLPP